MAFSYPNLIYMYSSKPITLSLWDSSKISEFATTKQFIQHLLWEAEKFIFPFINICPTSNASLCLLEYFNDIVKMLMEWQVRILDDNGLFHKFWSSNFNILGDLMAQYRSPPLNTVGISVKAKVALEETTSKKRKANSNGDKVKVQLKKAKKNQCAESTEVTAPKKITGLSKDSGSTEKVTGLSKAAAAPN
ncbi:hypothetical protein EDD22DRAFT_957637 [Suillus occidentalis]|nr:hypothetical protein EDD22DRAFT_957637 [Suillus occidentalis]